MNKQIWFGLAMCVFGLTACGLPDELVLDTSKDTKSADVEYKDALLSSKSFEMKVPSSNQAPAPAAPTKKVAEFYTLTYTTSRNLSRGLVQHLDMLENIAHQPPTARYQNKRVWSWTPTLSPATYTFILEKRGPGHFGYLLTGRPESASNQAAVIVFQGELKRGLLPRRGVGQFILNFENARKLDPTNTNTRGLAIVKYDTRNHQAKMEVAHQGANQGKDQALYHYSLDSVGNGEFRFAFKSDIDKGKNGRVAQENGLLRARWQQSGAGRADVWLTGGDLSSQKVLMSECWSPLFYRTFYADNKGIHPSEGNASSCALPILAP